MNYLWLKYLHILSSTLIFGTGLGTAFYMFRAHLTRDVAAIAFASRNVVLADFLFTTPAVIIQPLTGILLIQQGHFAWSSAWLVLTFGLYLLTGACWLPVVWLQMQMSEMANMSYKTKQPLPAAYYLYYKIWFWLGWPAFSAVIIIFYLMIFKPGPIF